VRKQIIPSRNSTPLFNEQTPERNNKESHNWKNLSTLNESANQFECEEEHYWGTSSSSSEFCNRSDSLKYSKADEVILILKRNGCELEVVIKTGDNQTVLKPLQIR
jgi:hypothetical protein